VIFSEQDSPGRSTPPAYASSTMVSMPHSLLTMEIASLNSCLVSHSLTQLRSFAYCCSVSLIGNVMASAPSRVKRVSVVQSAVASIGCQSWVCSDPESRAAGEECVCQKSYITIAHEKTPLQGLRASGLSPGGCSAAYDRGDLLNLSPGSQGQM
jgi:hypothetical protein